jgi:hypothetical protein
MDEPMNSQASVALGTWIGREQAFNALAHHCSAARVACLKQVRDTEAYKGLNITWEQFCPDHAGISRTHADRLIRQLAEFGAPYFELTDIVPVSPAAYREIEPAITDGALEFQGEQIPITRENAARIKAAVNVLRKQVDRLENQAGARTAPGIIGVQIRFDVCFDDMIHLIQRNPSGLDRASLHGLLVYCGRKLADLTRRLPEVDPA